MWTHENKLKLTDFLTLLPHLKNISASTPLTVTVRAASLTKRFVNSWTFSTKTLYSTLNTMSATLEAEAHVIYMRQRSVETIIMLAVGIIHGQGCCSQMTFKKGACEKSDKLVTCCATDKKRKVQKRNTRTLVPSSPFFYYSFFDTFAKLRQIKALDGGHLRH